MLETFEEKLAASREHFASMAGQPITETTPPEITPEIRAFASTLDAESPVWVPVISDQYGLFGWCSDGVNEKILHDGGSIRFGWAIWELPKTLLTAEFHAVWMDATGEMHDITPKPGGEERILFVPDKKYGLDFDFDKRPPNRRSRLYKEPDYREEALLRINAFKPNQLEYESRRAAENNESLEERMVRKIKPNTSVANTIDSFIEVCDRYDEKMDELLPGSGYLVPDAELLQLAQRRSALNAKVVKISLALEK